ncbi:ABC transporter permease [Mobilitalea sibirica]|uniref:ABC transporter permease n=1 Tax=Mobilitalea sibirica TaxID=1462919 RepID=A0A8J7KW64_9FIRM|nr:ABC transporter permease [Mobilitalea sibirica]MBH1940990.1 ABC transporter permease [Mobilitalea sibirica]
MFHIIMKETKEFLREKTNLFFFLMFPVVLVFLLGNLLGSMDNAEEAIGSIKVQYLIETENIYHAMAVEGFISSVEDDESIIFDKATDLDSAKNMAADEAIDAVVVFQGEPLKIQIYEGRNNIKNRTVSAIMNGFIQTNKSMSAIIKTVPDVLSSGITLQDDMIKQKDLGVNRSMLDYYAVTMMTMICSMSIILGSAAFKGERQNKTVNRLIIAPKNRVTLFLAKILGMVPQTILQIVLLMVVSVLFFNAHYAGNIIDNVYLFFMFFIITLCMISIGAVIGLLIKGSPVVILMPFIWIVMFFSGSYSKEVYIKGFSDAMPIYQIQEAAFDLAVFGRYGRANIVIITSIIVMFFMLTLGAVIFSRKEGER